MKKLSIITLGCQMNKHDSEWVAGLLADEYEYADENSQADLLIVNTCAVREKAEQKFFSLMGRLAPLKAARPKMVVSVAGCVAQDKAEEIVKRAPIVDIVFGTRAIERFPTLLQTYHETGQTQIDIADGSEYDQFPMKRSSSVSAWVSIMRGCDNCCSYCIVPATRGAEQSRPADSVVEEVRVLGESDFKEVWLLGQNVNSYGRGLTMESDFPQLLRRLDNESKIPWFRFMTSHPKDLSDALIDAMANSESVCPALHLPIQSGSNKVLEMMRRGYSADHYFDRVEKLRKQMPDICLTTDIIVGFPGETEEDHRATLTALDRAQYDNIFLFKYSPREGTSAADLPDRIDGALAQERFEEVSSLQKAISRERLSRFVGKEREILVDGPSKRDKDRYTGRTKEGIAVNFESETDYTRSFVRVKIVASKQYSLVGEIISKMETG